jgi:antagonist of KipI
VIQVSDPGRWTTIQDRGRPGLERFGIPPGGAADWFAAAAANRIVGNQQDAALLEATVVGPTLQFDADAVVAITGGQVDEPPGWKAIKVLRGSKLAVGTIGPGVRTYVAVRGGIDVPIVLGSRSYCQRGNFGGGFSRPLAASDRLAIGRMIDVDPMTDPWSGQRLQVSGPWEVRVIAGPQEDAFPRAALEQLTATACRVTPEIDRMGLRLETPGLRLQPEEILTVPMTAGAVQVTPSGGLIVLHVDHQTTGGYPVIATVINADLPLLAQARPGDTVRFRAVAPAEAARAGRRLTDWLHPES